MYKSNIKNSLILLCTMSVLIVFFVYPILVSVAQSLGYFPELGLHEITFRYYIELFGDARLWESAAFTLMFAFVSSGISVAVGVFLAHIFYRNNGGTVAEKIVRLPILTPHIVATLIVYLLFAQSGIIARICYHLGLITETAQFLPMTQDSLGLGVIVTYLWKGIPFVLVTVLSVLRSTNSKLSAAAENLGASRGYTFLKVVLPAAVPNIITSFLLLFAFSFGAFEAPFLLGPTTPKALPVLSYQYYTGNDLTDRVYAMAINVLITLFCLLLLAVYLYADKKRRSYNMDSHLPTDTGTVASKSIARLICAAILLSFLPLLLWAFSTRWQWPLLLPESLSARALVHMFTGSSDMAAVVTDSLLVSGAVTFATIALTLPAARILARGGVWLKSLWYALIWAPFLVPATSVGMGMYTVMLQLGLENSFFGVVLANIVPCIPYAMLMLQSACELHGDRYEQQAFMLGESRLNVFFKVTLPMLAPAIRSAAVMVFMVSFGQYFLTFLIGGGLVKTLPLAMFPYIQQGDRVLSSIYSIVYIIVILLVTGCVERIGIKRKL